MDLSFANPAGWWALGAVPVILAIHLLQRQSRRVVTSTLFLFDALRPVSAQGRRIERVRNSLPLWLQIAAAVLLAALLAGPRSLRRDSGQRIVVVLDSSVSMGAFRDELARALPPRLRALTRVAAQTEWHLLETDPARPTLYAGPDLPRLLAALDGWTPHLGTHDFAPALQAAHGLAGAAGLVVFVTDRKTDVPDGVETLAVGRPLDNCGWVGVSVEGARWRALVQDHAAAPQTRAWHLEVDGSATPDETLTLAPGQVRTLAGAFPAGKDRCTLVLGGDAFALDDRLPLVRPEPKRLALFIGGGERAPAEFLRRFADSVPQTDLADSEEKADLCLDVLAPGTTPARPAVLFAPAAAGSKAYLPGEPLAENDPLTAGLVWNGLLCKATDPAPPQPGDRTLLWQGVRPLIFLRGDGLKRALVVNFDLRQSNADRLPAFVVLLGRFAESVRAEKVAFERRNAETNQPLAVAADPAGPPPQTSDGTGNPPRAPAAPGFFEVRQGDAVRLEGAAHFADPREADFKDAASFDTLEGKAARLRESHSRDDVLWPVFALALGAVLLAGWWALGREGGRTA